MKQMNIPMHDGAAIEAYVQGEGPAILLPVNPIPAEGAKAEELRAWGVDPALGRKWMDGLSDRYRVVAFDYEGHAFRHPKPETLTPDAIAADFLAVMDAVGAETFAYYGYSWLALCGLQLAIRTGRLSALVMGGFPPLGGPYREMLAVTRATHRLAVEAREKLSFSEQGRARTEASAEDGGPAQSSRSSTGEFDQPVGESERSSRECETSADEYDWSSREFEGAAAEYDWSQVEVTQSPEQTRQFATLYESLQTFDDRAALALLNLPRLVFAGTADRIEYGDRWGGVTVDIAGALVHHRDELAANGWDVRLLDGLDHAGAMQPGAALPVVRAWLDGLRLKR